MYRRLFDPVDGREPSALAMHKSVEFTRQLCVEIISSVSETFGELLRGSHTKAVMQRSRLPLLVLH